MFTFEDLENMVRKARELGISSTDVVAFRVEDESSQHPSTIFIVKGVDSEPETSVEGNSTSVGGTFLLYGREY